MKAMELDTIAEEFTRVLVHEMKDLGFKDMLIKCALRRNQYQM